MLPPLLQRTGGGGCKFFVVQSPLIARFISLLVRFRGRMIPGGERYHWSGTVSQADGIAPCVTRRGCPFSFSDARTSISPGWTTRILYPSSRS